LIKKKEIQALKNERMMYNERLGEIETEIRKGKTFGWDDAVLKKKCGYRTENWGGFGVRVPEAVV
jgi:hypothetical protein